MNATLTTCTTNPNCREHEVRTVRPKADVFQTDDAWLITLDLPGADETTTEISIEKDVLTIKASALEMTPEGFEKVHTEFAPRQFERAFRLPDEVDRSAIDATVKNGVLHLTLPKSPETKPHQVVVKGG